MALQKMYLKLVIWDFGKSFYIIPIEKPEWTESGCN